MVLKNCVNLCQKKPTCEDPNPPEPPCKAMCRPMCVCKPGFVNNDEGDCIPLSWCRTCKVSYVFTCSLTVLKSVFIQFKDYWITHRSLLLHSNETILTCLKCKCCLPNFGFTQTGAQVSITCFY